MQEGCTGPKSLRSKFTVVGCQTSLLSVLHSSQFGCKKCALKLNRAVDTSRTNSEAVHGYLRVRLLLACVATRYSTDVTRQLTDTHITWQHYMMFIPKVGLSYIDHMNDDTTLAYLPLLYEARENDTTATNKPWEKTTVLLSITNY